jgi:CheY-like chemotaxis protein
VARSRAEAERVLRDHRFGLILCDHHLGDAKGTELCDRLLRGPQRDRCVIISGSEEQEVFGDATPVPFRFLQKPVDAASLLALARSH